MPILDSAVQDYLQNLSRLPGDEILAEMERIANERSFPIVGPQVGRLLSILTRVRGAKSVFELGSGYGYSTLWFARAVGEGGVVHHTDGSKENSEQAKGFLERAGVGDRVKYHVGDAAEALKSVGGPHDIFYMDIDKHQYPGGFDVLRPMMRPGDLLIVDNMIWGGRVVDPDAEEADTRGIQELTRRVFSDDGLEPCILPVRDGVLVSRCV
ncbi:MAG: O-methyltransferase [Planctomycetota bacterium]